MKNKLLIIDDRWDIRAEIYKRVLESDFNISYIEKGSQLFEKLANEDVDAYLIDIVLTKWQINNKPLQVLSVLEKIGNNKPIILVSNEYENLVKDKELTPLINTIIDKGYNVNSFLIWSDFTKAFSESNINNTETIQSTIKLDILKYQKFKEKKAENEFDFAVICALGEELKPFLNKFIDIRKDTVENIRINKSILTTKSGNTLKFLAVQQQEMGTVDAAILASKLVSMYNIKHLFLIGVCGGRDDKVKIGDIIIPHEIVAYQNGKINQDGFIVNVGYAKSNGNIRGAVENNSDQILKEIYKNYIIEKIEEGFSLDIKCPTIKYEEMACGAVIINKIGELDRIAKTTARPKICSVDMESFSIFRICEILNIKASVIKSVMDLSSHKSDKFKEYAAYVSANYLYSVLYQEILTF